MSTEEFIAVDFKLPDHSNELCKAEEVLEKLKIKFQNHQKKESLADKSHTTLFEEIVRVLDYVGNLSVPCFKIEDDLEALYVYRYKHAPMLGKKLWLDHYEHIHHPYTLIKNRCFRLLDELDAEYKRLYDKNPPNWNI